MLRVGKISKKNMQIKYFDIHSHFNLPQFDKDRTAAIKRMEEKQVATICVGTDLETSKKAVEIAETSDYIWATVGQHPTDTEEEFDLDNYRELAKHSKVVAIGETGLDYYHMEREAHNAERKEEIKSKQKEVFKKHIELAIEIKKPLMIHARPSKNSMDAYEDALDILENATLRQVSTPSSTRGAQGSRLRANFHFFVGDLEIAKRILENGWTVSFDGPITFSNDYDEVIKMLPLESIMAETDAPFAAPAPYRGKFCEPWMVEEVVKKIAEVKSLDLEIVRAQLLENVKRVFLKNVSL